MEIPRHYQKYDKKTLIVISNNDRAILFLAQNRKMKEIDTFAIDDKERDDDMLKQKRASMYHHLNGRLKDYLKEDKAEAIILCAPEARKDEMLNSIDQEVSASVTEFVPKNLASLPTDQVIRILQETRVA